ncbi:MAG TPA: YwiC-like family protein [Candidatus Angelobacter sp.]|nr:YwiC-like family protein [Candidatus Angelobacter sp.]
MVVPREHGAWGMLLVPLLTGAVVAAGKGANVEALILFVLAALALFWMRTPVEAWLGTTAIRAQSAAERATVIRVIIPLALLAVAAIGGLFALGLWRGLLIIGAIAAVAFVLQAVVKGLGRRGRMPAQIVGAVGLTSTAAGAYYVSTGRLDHIPITLWLANWLFAGNQVHYVQIRIRGSKLATMSDKVRQAYGFLAGQIILLTTVLLLVRYEVLPVLAVLAFVPGLARGFLWFLRGAEVLDVHKLGFAELAQSIVFGALLCLAYRW